MAKELKGTKTEQNLLEAFAGESMARNKYTYFASKARKDGYVQIAAIFEETANNEKEHAKMWFKLLEGGEIKDTAANLLHAAEGENAEWTDMYVRMAEEADAEGFPAIAHKFRMVAAIEKAQVYRAENIEEVATLLADELGVPERRDLGMRELRPYRCGQESAGNLPGVRASAELLHGQGGKLLIFLILIASTPPSANHRKRGAFSFVDLWEQHAHTVCRCAHLNREKGVERVEDPSRVQGRALLGQGAKPLGSPPSFISGRESEPP